MEEVARAPASSRRTVLAAALTSALVGLALGVVAARHPAWTWDVAGYVLTAEEVRATGRLRMPFSQLQADTPWPDADGRTPFPGQAPGYPLLLAALGTSRTALGGALLWNALAHALTAGLAALLAARLATRGASRAAPFAALAAGLATAGSMPLLGRVPWVMSESTFAACQTGALLLAVLAPEARRPLRLMAAAGLLAGLACLVRTAGVALLAPLAWTALVALRREGWRARATGGLALLGPPVLALLVVPLRGEPAALAHLVPRGSLEAAGQVAGILVTVVVTTNWGATTTGLVVVACGVAALLDLVDRRRADAPAPPGWPVPLLAVLGACGLLFYGFHKLIYPEPRYGVPLLPPFLALLAAPAARLAAASAPSARVPGAVALALLAGVPLAFAALRLDPSPTPVPLSRTATMAWVASSAPPGELVVTNGACWLAWETGRPAAQLPHRFLHSMPEAPATWLPAALRACRARHLVLFRDLDPAGYGPTIVALQRGSAISPDLAVVWSGVDGVVWRLRDQ